MDQETLHAVMKEWIEDCKRKWEDSATEGPTGSMEVHKNTSEGLKYSLGYESDSMDNVSLISEEDLLTTIFCACDVERTGKVAVSKIVDYLRHTTSRGLEDNGIEELFRMLDPDKKDVSMDLGTFHAVMKEWIEDCKGKWEDSATEGPTGSMEVHKNTSEAKEMLVRMNVTSGSLEAFGGDVSKGDVDVSDLITCVADLQYKNQKLQEENNKLKLTLEAVDEANNKLLADNEDLRQQTKSIQHSVLQAKSLEEELEEVKTNLNLSEEKREQILCQNKQLEKENQALIIKITSLQEENIRNSVEADGLQKKILELSKDAAELEVQAHIYESTVVNKEASLAQKEQAIKELKLTVVECSSIIETLRAEKKKLLETMQHMQQELILNGLSLPLLCKFNSSIPEGMNSLHCELELAQSSEITKAESMSLDETLDREVLFLLQGPEYAGENFKAIMQNLLEEASESEELIMTSLEWVKDFDVNMQQAWERNLGVLKQELGEKRHLWIQKLNLLEKYKEALERDFIRMASNLRRAKTEEFHLRKELSARQHEIKTVKQLQAETAGQAEALGLELQKATTQLEDASKQVEDQAGAFHSACEEAASLKCKLEEATSEQQKLRDVNAALTSTCQLLQEKVNDLKTTANVLRWELLQRRLCELLCQCYVELQSDSSLLLTSDELVKGKIDCEEPRLPATLIPSSDHLTSPQEVLTPSLENTAAVTGTLATEGKSLKYSDGKADDVLAAAAMEDNKDKDPATPLSGANLPKKEEFCSVTEEHKPASQNALKQDLEVDQEKKSAEEQSKEAAALVPSRKGSSHLAGGIKGDKTKPNELDSPNEKEVEAEFLRLSLGFKCDLFTLDKRVRLEERSRDLAEENLKKEITNALKMLEALASLCEEDNQAQEIIKKLQKSLQFLSQYAARVASRAEMLGAINQESRVSKAVEVMIQHVENLKRMYAKEHAELEELKQVLLHNERSFTAHGDRDEATNKKLSNPFNFKPPASLRRVSIAALPRSVASAGIGLQLAQLREPDGGEHSEKFHRRSSSWGRLGAKQSEKRPSLQRFMSTYSWAEYEEEHPETKTEQSESPAEVQEEPSKEESVSDKRKSSKWNLEEVCKLMASWVSHFKTSFSNANKTFWFSVSILVLLAALTSFLTGLSLQRPADAAPVGTGDSWTLLQQLLWPYVGLQHYGPPPI